MGEAEVTPTLTPAQLDRLNRLHPDAAYCNKYSQIIAEVGSYTFAVLDDGSVMDRGMVDTSLEEWSEQAVEFDWIELWNADLARCAAEQSAAAEHLKDKPGDKGATLWASDWLAEETILRRGDA